MRKNLLNGDQMSSVEYVERAATWSRELTRFRARGPGDTENAMRAIERDYGIDYWIIWRLRYRVSQVKSICASVYHRLGDAYLAECERQERKFALEFEITKALVGPHHPTVVAAAAVVGETEAEEGDATRISETDGS